MDLREEQIYHDANKFWGNSLIYKTIASCLELVLELNKLQNNESYGAEAKLAEALMSCERLTLILDPEEVEDWKEKKLNFLDSEIKKEQDLQNTAICTHPTSF